MTTLRSEITHARLDRLAQQGPEVAWNAFQYAALLLLHELREKARKAAMGGAPVTDPGPEDSADELLDQISLVGARARVDPDLVGMALDGVQRALYGTSRGPDGGARGRPSSARRRRRRSRSR